MDHTIPAGWGGSRWLPCLDWQAGGIPDAHFKSRKILYQLQPILVFSAAEFFLFGVSSFIRYRKYLQLFYFLIASFTGNVSKFKGNIFRFKGLSTKYDTIMKTKHLQNRS